jgi:pimeloyl-ACP methyl ester carboxylesterase
MQERFLTANGLRLRWVDWGGDGPDLLFVHPTGFVADIWAPFAERLRDRCRCVALDTRGHGDSDKPGDYRGRLLVEDLSAFVEAAGLRRPAGIGHSAGATQLAGLEASRPGSFGSLVLMEPVLTFEPRGQLQPEQARLVPATLKRRAVWPGRQEAYDSFRARPPFQDWDERCLRAYVEHGFADLPDGTVALKCPPETEAQMYAGDHPWLLDEPALRRVRCPVLLLRSSESPVFGEGLARRTASLLPDCRAATLPGGHFAPFERVDLAMTEIERFLGAVPSTRPAAGECVR